MIGTMKSRIRAGAVLALLALSAGCVSTEQRDQPEDIRNALRRDALACGTDTACLKKRDAAREHVTPPTRTQSAKPAETP